MYKIDESSYSEFIPDYENTYFKEVFDIFIYLNIN